MLKLTFALAALVAAGCGGGGGSHTDAAATDTTVHSDDADIDAPADDAGMTAITGGNTRLIVSGAKRLHGANGLVIDVEVGHAMDQDVRTSGSLVVRGANAFGN
jgi:hypothetical protein